MSFGVREQRVALAAVLEVFALHPRRPEGYGAEVRAAVVGYARRCREAGWTWSAIAAGLPVSGTSVQSWVTASSEGADGGSLLPVEVIEAEPPVAPAVPARLTVVSPRGYRLEGLLLEDAIRVLGSLG